MIFIAKTDRERSDTRYIWRSEHGITALESESVRYVKDASRSLLYLAACYMDAEVTRIEQPSEIAKGEKAHNKVC